MNDIATLYINKVNQIYDKASELQRVAKDKDDSLKTFMDFCDHVIENTEIISQFKNISNGICQIIDKGNFDISKIDQIKAVKDLASQVSANISNTKRFLTNEHENECTEFEKLIEDCFNNMTFGVIDNYKTNLENANKRLLKLLRDYFAKYQGCISVGHHNVIGLKTDGTVIVDWNIDRRDMTPSESYDRNPYGYCVLPDMPNWRNIVMVSISSFYAAGLRSDGTVITARCRWFYHDGSGEATRSFYQDGNQGSSFNTSSWCNIVAIATGYKHIVGLKSDGTVVAVGNNEEGLCNTSAWRDIVAIDVGYDGTIGLKADSTIVNAGKFPRENKNWRDIVAICGGRYGLKSDGTIVSTYNNDKHENWRDIVAISCNGKYGLKSDGTVVSTDDNDDCKNWRDIVAINELRNEGRIGDDKYCPIGLKADGTIVGMYSHWSNIGPVDKEQQEQRRIRQISGLCQHCGGELSFWGNKCKSCGKKKDY